ncbi:MAG: hypothetical protein U9N76_01375 [Candidatus Marinimicrobia bacterium]|nr:hypothetical protein [Candidatus Neomarinimicrobiota bacterium]
MYKETDLVKLIDENRQLLIIIGAGFVFFLIIFFIYLIVKK